MTNEQTDVLAVIERMTADFQRGTIDAVMSAYERGAVVLFEPSVPVTDTEAIRQTFTEWMALKPKFTYSGHEVYVAGDLAVHIAPWSMTGTAPDGSAINQDGLSVAALRRQSDGSWRMVIDNPHGALAGRANQSRLTQLSKAHLVAVARAPGSVMMVEDVRHFQRWATHTHRRLHRSALHLSPGPGRSLEEAGRLLRREHTGQPSRWGRLRQPA